MSRSTGKPAISKSSRASGHKAGDGRFTLGRAGFGKISAVEGLRLTGDMRKAFDEFDRQGLSAEERRREIKRRYAKPSA